jgi:hypothetical protein
MDRQVLRHIYWNQPTIKVRDIQAAVGIRNIHELVDIVGPGHFEEPCRSGCGVVITRTVTSRNDAAGGNRHGWDDPRFCQNCQQRNRDEGEQRHLQRWARASRSPSQWDAEEKRIAAGARVVRRYVGYEGVGGTWADPEFEPPTQ